MQETDLYAAWFHYARTGSLAGCRGHCLNIIEPGQLNQARGPDIRTARFNLDGVVYQGSIEFHCQIGDWYLHQHHLDPLFEDVLLHIIASSDADKTEPVYHQSSGHPIPTIMLDTLSDDLASKPECKPCNVKYMSSEHTDSLFKQFALQRLNTKVRFFQSQLMHRSFQHIFYDYFFRALGYPNNKMAFQRLATTVELYWLKLIHSQNADMLYALYAGIAGFLTTNNRDAYTHQIYENYQSLKPHLSGNTQTIRDWQYAANRPNNHPHFRLAAWVALLNHYGPDPGQHLWRLFGLRQPYELLTHNLQKALRLQTSSYWAKHFALGQKTQSARQFYLGIGRITEVTINLIIPLFIARAHHENSEGFAAYIQAYYLWQHTVQMYNKLKRQFPWFRADNTKPVAAYQVQALLFLDQNFCRLQNCHQCPLVINPV